MYRAMIQATWNDHGQLRNHDWSRYPMMRVNLITDTLQVGLTKGCVSETRYVIFSTELRNHIDPVKCALVITGHYRGTETVVATLDYP